MKSQMSLIELVAVVAVIVGGGGHRASGVRASGFAGAATQNQNETTTAGSILIGDFLMWGV